MSLDATAWAAIAAWAAVLVTGVGLWFTASQARSARESRVLAQKALRMAEDQARSARESAASSGLAARATVDQAQSSRESVQLLQREQDRADKPEFDVAVAPLRDGVCGVTAKMTSGPPSIVVTVDWIGESSWPSSPVSREVGIRVGSGLGDYTVVRDEEFGFPVDVPPQADQGHIRLDMVCADANDPERVWSYRRVVKWRAAERPFVG
jgi:hypothetical protein